MPQISLLDQGTIDKIAAGEVVERPSSVVKELVENAIDAQATAVTVEIKEGGISFIRITDNGCGMEHAQVPVAFLRHSTSKITCVEDLLHISSLGFRGEALSSIAAVSQVEVITKTYTEITGTRYVIEGSAEKENEEIGAPEGTTFIVRNLFYNTPARRKFLKTAQTEGGYISDLMERLALSHPDVSFKFINNGQTKLHTSGNSNEKDLVYHIYGRDITAALTPVQAETDCFSVRGFLGKPQISRGNRNLENYFINGRYVRSALISRAVEEAYRGFLMQRQYPFCLLYFTMDSNLLDVNVHPTKMELRFSNQEELYQALYGTLRNALTHREYIPEVPVEEKKEEKISTDRQKLPEPFEKKRIQEIRSAIAGDTPYEIQYPGYDRRGAGYGGEKKKEAALPNQAVFDHLVHKKSANRVKESDTYAAQAADAAPEQAADALPKQPDGTSKKTPEEKEAVYEQQTLLSPDTGFLTETARKKHKMIGQLFDTYWMVEYEDRLFIIDQHAAHEKVLYEKTMAKIKNTKFTSQTLCPPVILSLNQQEESMLKKYEQQIAAFGYHIEHFGGKEYALNAVPAEFEDIDMQAMFIEMLDDFIGLNGREAPDLILEKVASMSCKAAVKGNQRLSVSEADQLIKELLELDNPYHCPHGRPTIISMSKYEIEKKFKRIV